MSVWLHGPVASSLVDGDMCEAIGGWCDQPATVIAHNQHGSEILLRELQAERHGPVALAVAA